MTDTEKGTALVERQGGFDLTHAPWRQWDKQMVDLCKATVFPQAQDEATVYFCLAVADSLSLNPFAGEVYFIPSKARDGNPAGAKPYIGREGLVKKASEREYYFEGDVVCEHDKFRVMRRQDGSRTCTHSYSHDEEKRGSIVGAYAFLHSKDPSVKPAFFYARMSEYTPNLTSDKLAKSPWGNQTSSMILKCAMIGAGRQRLNLSGVLIDAEVDRYLQQGSVGGVGGGQSEGFDFGLIGDEDVRERLRKAVEAARKADPDAWPAAKCEMVFTGRSNEELATIAAQIESETATHLETRASDPGAAASGPVVDAEVVTPEMEQLDELRLKEASLSRDLGFAQNADDEAKIRADLDQVRAEIRRIGGEAPGQDSLDIS